MMSLSGYANRRDAGLRLAKLLTTYAGRGDVVVLGLPRGGVPVAAEVARALRAPLDVFIVRKLGAPWQPELALGAIAEGGLEVRHAEAMHALGVSDADLDRVAERERDEVVRRSAAYRGSTPPTPLAGRWIVIVDDGLATGSTMEAAIAAVRTQGPAGIVVAVPVGAPDTCARLAPAVEALVCPLQPRGFDAVGEWYSDFSQTTDDEVRRLLSAAETA